MRQYFHAYFSYLEAIEPLTDAERGRLFTACLAYGRTGKAPELRGNERYVFASMKGQIDRDNLNYDHKCAVNRINGAQGGKANAAQRIQTVPNDGETSKEKEKNMENERGNIPPRSPLEELEMPVREAFENFISSREKMRRPMTKEAIRLAVDRLKSLSDDVKMQVKIIEQSIERGWSGLFEVKEGVNPYTQKKPRALDYPQRAYTAEDLKHIGINFNNLTADDAE